MVLTDCIVKKSSVFNRSCLGNVLVQRRLLRQWTTEGVDIGMRESLRENYITIQTVHCTDTKAFVGVPLK